MGPIAIDDYTQYIRERFQVKNLTLTSDVSRILQEKMYRIPESINRFCDYIYTTANKDTVIEQIDPLIYELVEQSRSQYEEYFSKFTPNQKQVLLAFARVDKVQKISSKDFLKELPNISKTGVIDIVNRFLDESVVSSRHSDTDLDFRFYQLTDPLFTQYLRQYKLLS